MRAGRAWLAVVALVACGDDAAAPSAASPRPPADADPFELRVRFAGVGEGAHEVQVQYVDDVRLTDRGTIQLVAYGSIPGQVLELAGKRLPLRTADPTEVIELALTPLVEPVSTAALDTARVELPYEVSAATGARGADRLTIGPRGLREAAGVALATARPTGATPPATPRSLMLVGWQVKPFGAPTAVRDVDLVALATVTPRKVGTCGPYGTAGMDPVAHWVEDLAIRVVVRATGETLDTRTIRGKPRRCPDRVVARDGLHPSDVRDAMPEDAADAWLASLIPAS